MTNPVQSVAPEIGVSSAQDVLSRVRISSVYQWLTDVRPRRSGPDRWRGPATWRGGEGLSVSLDDQRGLWHDFVTDEGGGVLHLVERVRGGSRQDALRWLAAFTGLRVESRPVSPAERARWAVQHRQIEAALPKARLWRRAAMILGEEVLEELKARLYDPNASRLGIDEIAWWTAELVRLRRLEGNPLVEEYVWWERKNQRLTEGMVRAVQKLEVAEERAIMRYVNMMVAEMEGDPGNAPAGGSEASE